MAKNDREDIRLFHGIDIVEIARVAAFLSDKRSDFRERCFTTQEIANAEKDEQFAGWFAAKEAVMKALGTGWNSGIGWRDIEVIHESGGKPNLSLKGKAQDIANQLKIRTWAISISHSGANAVASAIGIS